MKEKARFPNKSKVWISELTTESVLRYLALTVVFNTVIASFIYTANLFQESFATNFIMSQSIGLTICTFVVGSFWLFKPKAIGLKLILLFGTILIGTVAGHVLGVIVAGAKISDKVYDLPSLIKNLSLGLVFGCIVFYYFISRHQIRSAGEQAREEHLKRITSDKEMAEIQLRLLQAQIEPHFLFNTLSNVLSLLDTDVKNGKAMLIDLTRYLRLALDKSRSQTTTLGQELDTVCAYMNIHKVRMGDRLEFSIEVPEDIKKAPLAPMLIQPLVENAIKHGLEPKIAGGQIDISISKGNGILQISVADTGEGISDASGDGVGLINIRQRLQSIYGQKGNLTLKQNSPCGVIAVLEVAHDAV